uniref:Uncharacterized protein n=1 Tax=Tanacetum cinerariifolium TaxID=118510 RepID=A0A6L2K1P9_TANCI|nr:hypothetical protein [Tanacetum cinerariifolium]
MAISAILISSDSSKESVGTSTARVILFGTIPATIPSTIPTTDLPAIHDGIPLIHPLLHPFDTPDTPSSQDPYEVTIARWRSRVAARSSPPSSHIPQILPAPPRLPRRPVVLVLPGQPIPIVRPYHSSSKTSSDSHSDTSSNSSSRHSSSGYAISDSPCDLPTATAAEPSRKRHRSPTSSVPVVSPVCGALSPVRTDLLPPRKRISDFGFVTDVLDSYEPYTEPEVDTDIQADIDACIAFASDLKAKGMDVRVVVETTAEEEVEFSARGMVEVELDSRVRPVIDDDVRESVRQDVPDRVTAYGAVEVTYETLRDLVQIFHDHAIKIPAYWIQVIESA